MRAVRGNLDILMREQNVTVTHGSFPRVMADEAQMVDMVRVGTE
jgi:hypothetical protein